MISCLPLAALSLADNDHRHWYAELNLEFKQHQGKSLMVKNEHLGPLRVQRPFYPEGPDCCHVYLLHPPGGMVLGDKLQIKIHLNAAAHSLVTTPSAAKLYNTQGALEQQTQSMNFNLDEGACMEWLPQETIVFNGANAKLLTRIHLLRDAQFCGWDITCLGRPTLGEQFTQGRLEQVLEVWREQRNILQERNRWTGGHSLLNSRWGLNGMPVYGTFIATLTQSRDQVDELLTELATLAPSPDHQWGITQKGELLIARYWGNSTRLGRLGFEFLWQNLRPKLWGRPAVKPRIWNT
jgi:urease accessory protein